jgi:hypothetical protein
VNAGYLLRRIADHAFGGAVEKKIMSGLVLSAVVGGDMRFVTSTRSSSAAIARPRFTSVRLSCPHAPA